MNGDLELEEPTPAPGTAPLVEPTPGQRIMAKAMPYLVDLWIVTVWFAIAAVVGAFLWEWVTPLAAFTRTADNGVMDEQQFAKQISGDGWFFVIASALGLLSGLVLILWRRKHPLTMVVAVAVAGALATWLMKMLGLDLGPEDPRVALGHAQVGDQVPLQLKLASHGLYYVWSIAALAGGVIALFIGEFVASWRRNNAAMREFRQAQAAPAWMTSEPPPNG